ncbi:MAG: sporulation protein YqfD [Clostridium sp.]|nr:sporulation protein YqfD [Clostridium sp.]
MIQIIRYIKGYLAIKVFGFSPERFMNLCSYHDIFLWDVENHGDYYAMKISLKGFYKLRGITRKTGTRVVITKRYGLPFLSTRIWKRRIFMFGLLGSLFFWVWMSRFIWAVEIEGNYYVTTDVFRDFLAESGVEVGMKKERVQIEELEKAIRTQFDIVTWTSAQIEGTKLLIRVKENDVVIDAGEDGEPQEAEEGLDLVAPKEGEIVSIVTRSGIPKVTAGASVAAGDVLVEGGVPILNEDGTVKRYDYCRADADIMLRCIYNMKEEIGEKHEQKYYTGNEKKYPFLMLGTKKIRLPGAGGYETSDVIEEKTQLRIFKNYYLPVYVGKDVVREYVVEEKIYTKEEVKELFEAKIQNFIESLQEKGVQIIEKNVTISKASTVWKMNVDFLAVEKTGIPGKTRLEQIETEEN